MARTTKLDMLSVVILRRAGTLGGVNTCGTPAITCARHQAGCPAPPARAAAAPMHPFVPLRIHAPLWAAKRSSFVRNGPFNLRQTPSCEGAGPTLRVRMAERGWRGSPLPAPPPARTGLGVARKHNAVSQAGVPAPAGGCSGPLLPAAGNPASRLGVLGRARVQLFLRRDYPFA